jgi:hypothetical protein
VIPITYIETGVIMKYIEISRKRLFTARIHSSSSSLDSSVSVQNILAESGYWSTEKRNAAINEFVILDFGENQAMDFIELIPSPGGASTFPGDFRFEWSDDASMWHVLHSEVDCELEGDRYHVQIPLTAVRYLKFIVTKPAFSGDKYFFEIAQLNAGISGIADITASSSLNDENSVSNLLDDNEKTFWSSAVSSTSGIETVSVDLGSVYPVNRILLATSVTGFPEDFHVEISTDGELWTTLFEVKKFRAESFRKYFWDTPITPLRYLRIEARGTRLFSGQFGVQISGIEISSAINDYSHTHNIGDLTPYASIFQAGMVRLARDGEDSAGTVVQGSDWRLRDATTIFKGITQLAADGDSAEGLVVQASDSRLKPADEHRGGIVRLAYDRETQAGTAVQGSDSRLQEATTEQFGIVRICPDGLYSEQSVISGNDTRIHRATEQNFGICRLAADGDNTRGTVVQASDSRLRSATTLYQGIAELAEDGEAGLVLLCRGMTGA